MKKRPFIGAIKPYTWNRAGRGEQVHGLLIGGLTGVAAHVTKAEAFELANRIVDAAESLTEQSQRPAGHAKAPREPKPCYLSRSDTLTDAAGAPEPPLPNIAPD